MPRLNEQEAAMTGYTDVFVVKHGDLTETTDDTAQTLTYTVNAGEVVEIVDAHIVTAFNDSGGGDELDVEVGSTDIDGYIPNANGNLHTDDSVTDGSFVQGAGAYIDANGFLYTAADTIDFKFTPNRATGQSYALSELNAGEVRFYMKIRRMND